MLFIKKLHAIKKYVTHLSLTKVSNVEADEQLSFKSRYKSLCSSAVVLEQLSSVIFAFSVRQFHFWLILKKRVSKIKTL